MELPQTIGDRLGESLLGAASGQIVVADSTTVCFYKLAIAALFERASGPQRDRHRPRQFPHRPLRPGGAGGRARDGDPLAGGRSGARAGTRSGRRCGSDRARRSSRCHTSPIAPRSCWTWPASPELFTRPARSSSGTCVTAWEGAAGALDGGAQWISPSVAPTSISTAGREPRPFCTFAQRASKPTSPADLGLAGGAGAVRHAAGVSAGWRHQIDDLRHPAGPRPDRRQRRSGSGRARPRSGRSGPSQPPSPSSRSHLPTTGWLRSESRSAHRGTVPAAVLTSPSFILFAPGTCASS